MRKMEQMEKINKIARIFIHKGIVIIEILLDNGSYEEITERKYYRYKGVEMKINQDQVTHVRIELLGGETVIISKDSRFGNKFDLIEVFDKII